MTASTATTVQYLNLAYFGRPADPASLTAFPATGMTDEQIVEAFVKTNEYSTNTLAPSKVGSVLNQTSLINTFYQRLFGRLAVASEVAGWTNAIATGAVNEEYLGITIMRAGLNLPASTSMRQVLVAKFDSAQAFTTALAADPSAAQAYSTSAAADSAASYLTAVTSSTAASATATASAVTAMINTGNIGSSFALTTAVDLLSGTAKNDSFAATQATLSAADTIDGGAGNDTLAITHTGSANFTNVGKFTSIETVDVTNQSSSALVGGTTESNVVTFQALAEDQTITLAGVTFTAGTGGATAAQVAAAFADPAGAEAEANNDDIAAANKLSVGGGVLSGATIAHDADVTTADTALTNAMKNFGGTGKGFTVAAGGASNQVVVTAVESGNVQDLVLSGTAITGQNQKQTYVLTEAATLASQAFKITVNGTVINTQSVTATANDDTNLVGTTVANAINAYVGKAVASSAAVTGGTAILTIDSPDQISIANFAGLTDATDVTISEPTVVTSYAAPAAPTVVKTEGVAAVAAATYTTTVDASKVGGSTEMAAVNSTATVTFTNMVDQKAVVEGNGSLTNGDTNFTYKATATSTDVEVQNGVTAGAITMDASAATTATVTSTGAKNVVGAVDLDKATAVTLDASTAFTATSVGVDASSKASLTIKGAGKVSIGTLDAGFDTVNASANTGGVVAAIGNVTDTVFTGSAGADKITASTENTIASTAKLAVSGGAGIDTLVISDSNDINSAKDGARYTGFEKLSLVDDQDVSLVSGITTVAFSGDAKSITGLNSTNAVNLTLDDKGGNNVVDDVLLGLKSAKGTADVASINLTAAAATTNVGLTELQVAGFETLNVNFGTGSSANESAFDFEANDADNLTALNITGSANVHLTLDAAVMDVVAATIDASALTGKFHLSENSAALKAGSTVIATSQNDTLDATLAGVTYKAGAGVDAIKTSLAAILANGINDTVIDGGAGIDTLTTQTTTSNITVTDQHFTHLSNLEKLTLASTGDNTITVGTNFINTFGDSVTITSGTLANEKSFVYNGGLFNGNTTIVATAAANAAGDAAGESHSITTGSGNDKVTLTATGFVGAATGSTITVATGAGTDTIKVDLGTGPLANDMDAQAITIDAGTGKDTITLVKVNGHDSGTVHKGNALITLQAGDSTITDFDVITGFDVGLTTAGAGGEDNLADKLDFDGTSAVSDFTQSNDFGVIKSHSLSSGIATFDDTSVFDTALKINSSNLSDVLGYLAANTTKFDTVGFTYDSTGNGTADGTMVYNNNTVDSLVFLSGTTGTSIVGSAFTSTSGAIAVV